MQGKLRLCASCAQLAAAIISNEPLICPASDRNWSFPSRWIHRRSGWKAIESQPSPNRREVWRAATRVAAAATRLSAITAATVCTMAWAVSSVFLLPENYPRCILILGQRTTCRSRRPVSVRNLSLFLSAFFSIFFFSLPFRLAEVVVSRRGFIAWNLRRKLIWKRYNWLYDLESRFDRARYDLISVAITYRVITWPRCDAVRVSISSVHFCFLVCSVCSVCMI